MPARPDGANAVKGLNYGQAVWGKHRFRVRDTHVAEHLAALIARRATGAAKLDLLLRGIALLPQHAGEREVGLVLPRVSWEAMHDLLRPEAEQGVQPPELDSDAALRKLKRKWVGEQLKLLEDMGLILREERKGRRPKLVVLKDDASGDPFDDPDGSRGNAYTTITGSIFASGHLAGWKGQELAAYLAAAFAEHHDRSAQGEHRLEPGTGTWFRPLSWFADETGRFGAPARVRIPFSPSTLEKGFRALEKQELVRRRKTRQDPSDPARRLKQERVVYTNAFATLDAQAGPTLSAARYAAQLREGEQDLEP